MIFIIRKSRFHTYVECVSFKYLIKLKISYMQLKYDNFLYNLFSIMKSTVSKKWIASEGMLLSQCFGGRLIWHEFLFRWAFSIPPPSGSRRNVLGKSPILPIFVYCPCSSPFCPIGPLEKADSRQYKFGQGRIAPSYYMNKGGTRTLRLLFCFYRK